jgi:NADPH-dependent glutamate synthase beta subunit-like oxidoreductase/formate hydrogenlyase subunit 6/NADH:ubiquinone oxidoreductase subunit I
MNPDEAKLRRMFGEGEASISSGDNVFRAFMRAMPPCTEACPASVNAKAYVNLIAGREHSEAYDAIFQNNPLPGVCGRVCPHPCEDECSLADSGAISIMELKRFASDFEWLHKESTISQRAFEKAEKPGRIAVVGAGPAGLAAGARLAMLGHDVTVFEAEGKAGGMLSQGIPGYRLPRTVLGQEIKQLERLGVKIEVHRHIPMAKELLSKDFDFLILAAGTMREAQLPIEGIDKEGVIGCLAFLKNVNSGELKELPGRVIVFGGGSSAFDCARAARRMGADKVTIAYRRTEEEMPAQLEELEGGIEEGIAIETLAMPIRVIGDGKANAVEFLRAELGEPDESGRRRPVPVEGSEFQMECDWIIPAIGFKADVSDFSDDIDLTKWGTVKTGPGGQTSHDKIFATGDVVLGPSTVIKAIASGNDAAIGVHAKIMGMDTVESKEGHIWMPVIEGIPDDSPQRASSRHAPADERASNFEEINQGMEEHTAAREAARCLNCASCFECWKCLTTCDHKQLTGTANGESFIIKCPASLSKLVHEGVADWSMISDGSESKITLSSLTPSIDTSRCIACGRCEDVCAYRAVKVELRLDEASKAFVDHDVCRSCGACTAACPTGAISQGKMSQEFISREIRHHAMEGKPASFQCIWGSDTPFISKEEITLMCTRMLRPSTIIEAIAAGASGLAISSCDDQRCHYLPPEKDLENMLKATSVVLAMAGVDNVHYFSGKGLPAEVASAGKNRISQAYLSMLSLASLDKNDRGTLEHLTILDSLLWAEGLPVLRSANLSIERLIGKASIDRSVRDMKLSGAMAKLEPPSSVNQPVKIALVENGAGPMMHSAMEMLSSIQGVEINTFKIAAELSLDGMSQVTRQAAIAAIKAAENSGAQYIVPLELEAMATLGIYTREGSWQETSARVIDIFSLIQNELRGGE